MPPTTPLHTTATAEINSIKPADEVLLAKVLSREEIRKLYVVDTLASCMRPSSTIINLADYVLGIDVEEVVREAIGRELDAQDPFDQDPILEPVFVAFSDIDSLPVGAEISDTEGNVWLRTQKGWREVDDMGTVAQHEDRHFERWFLDLDYVEVVNPEILGTFTLSQKPLMDQWSDIHRYYNEMASAIVTGPNVDRGEE